MFSNQWMILLTYDLLLCELMFFWNDYIVLCKALENIFCSVLKKSIYMNINIYIYIQFADETYSMMRGILWCICRCFSFFKCMCESIHNVASIFWFSYVNAMQELIPCIQCVEYAWKTGSIGTLETTCINFHVNGKKWRHRYEPPIRLFALYAQGQQWLPELFCWKHFLFANVGT